MQGFELIWKGILKGGGREDDNAVVSFNTNTERIVNLIVAPYSV